MDVTRLREDFEGLSSEEQMEFMAAVGPAFCRSVMADPARRRLMMARCFREGGCSLGRIGRRLSALSITGAALLVGARAAATHLRQSPPPQPTS